jgi:hypothetical protein
VEAAAHWLEQVLRNSPDTLATPDPNSANGL